MSTLDLELIENVYERMPARLTTVRTVLGRPLTLTEKILYTHLHDFDESREVIPAGGYPRGACYVELRPDRVAMQDATAQMALLQLMTTSIQTVALPSSVHCDHLVEAREHAQPDLERAYDENREVYEFLEQCSRRFGIGFWPAGSGIIHQVVIENYAFPGGLMIGTDSHTPNAGGLGMLAIGVGGADAVDAMVGSPWEVSLPRIVGVHLTGELREWASPKDVILALAGVLTVKGGTGAVLEYFGPGTRTLSATGKATICNMGAEVGATASIFPFDERSRAYLMATGRHEIAGLCDELSESLRADDEVLATPEQFYDRVVEIDIETLVPHINGPFTPDRAFPVPKLASAVRENGWHARVSAACIGSCTNSSYEDIDRVVSLARFALENDIALKTELVVNPGSETIRATLERDGHLEVLEKIGARILANACGPCIGQWRRRENGENRSNSIVTSYNRNFAGRNDGNRLTAAFVASPDTVMAFALAGDLTIDFTTQGVAKADGSLVNLPIPHGAELPPGGFMMNREGFIPPVAEPDAVEVHVAPDSLRLQLLQPFEQPDLSRDFNDLVLLLKAAGKCTTDHISPAGLWLTFRGHLDKISDNLFVGATNAFSGKTNLVRNALTGEEGPVAAIARGYKSQSLGWFVVAEDNYGEGSSREHAAMEPRYLGCRVVLAKSFARIHETNLKKQGLLPLTFVSPEDYDRIQEGDRLSLDVSTLVPGGTVEASLLHANGTQEDMRFAHTFSDAQLDWLRAGSALNRL